jgi:ComEC/Rec2-related protein
MAIQVRQWVKQRLLLGVDPQSDEAKIIVAMALGERPLDAQELIDSYRLSGAIHVFAVSGLHVMMIGGIAAFFLKMLGLPRSVWVGGVILTMVAYALVTGLRPPALRAAVMGSVLLSAWVVGRKVVLVNSVAVAVIIALLLNGHMLFWPGFQLSFAVLIAIALFGNIGTRLFSWVSRVDPFLPRSLYSKWQEIWLQTRRRVQAALVVAASAWMGSSPLTLTHFGIVTPMSVLVSLPVVCLLYLSLCLGVVSLCAGLLWSPLGHVVNSANAQLASVSHAVVKGAANTPAAYHKSAPWSKGERVVIYALENGASANYLGLGGGVMLDVADKRQFQREVLPSLVKNGAGIDSVILSHEDHRHVGGLDALLEHFSPKQILVGDRGKADFGEAFVPRVLTVKGGERYPLGSRSGIESIDWAESQHGVADDRGAVFLLHWSGRKILFLHDVGYRFERWVVDSNNDLAADIIVWSGHARDESWGDDLLRVLKPSWLIGPRKVETAQNVGQINLLEKGALEIKVGELGLKADGYGSGVWLLE